MATIDKVFIEEAKARIAEDEAGAVIQQLLDFLKPQISSSFYDEIILHSAGYRRLEKQARQGFLAPAQANVQRNQLNHRVLSFLNELYRKNRKKENPLIAPATDVEINNEAGINFEKLVSENGLHNISWLEGGMKAAKSVCHIKAGREVGTGFLLRDGWLMTNHHVMPTEGHAASAVVSFNYQQDLEGQDLKKFTYKLDASTYRFSPMMELDYALVKVIDSDDNPPIQKWGYLELSDSSPEPKDYISIIQHPRGGTKQIATDIIKKKENHRVKYRANTEPGSSGSPVFDKEWKIVALHHAAAKGEPLNQGILINDIMTHLGDLADFFI